MPARQTGGGMTKEKRLGYRDIKASLLGRLHDRTWPPGSTIPNESALAAEFGCARATVNRALRELAEDGFLDRRRRAGTRVLNAPERHAKFQIPSVRAEIEKTGADYRYHLIQKRVLIAPDWLCGQMGLAAGQQVVHIRCVHFANQRPYQLEERWINLAAVPQAADENFVANLPGEWLLREQPYSDVDLFFSAMCADQMQSEVLNISVGEPVFLGERMTWFAGKSVTYVRLSFAPGYRMHTRV